MSRRRTNGSCRGGPPTSPMSGMTGPFDSVIGIKKEAILERFLMQMPNKFDVAKGDVRLQGVDYGGESVRQRASGSKE